jgi:hypothetical protein
MSSYTITAHEARRIAVAACVDPRSIKQYFLGRAKSTTSARIEQALTQLGRLDLVRRPSAEAHP